MDKRTFFIKAMQAGRLKDKGWLFRAFSRTEPKLIGETPLVAWNIVHTQDDIVFFDADVTSVTLSDFAYVPDTSSYVYGFKESLKLEAGDLPNVEADIETTYGNLVVNWLLLVYPFYNKIAYINRRFTIKDIESQIEKRLRDTPIDPSAQRSEDIYVDEYNRYRRAASLLDGLSQLCVPSASVKTMTAHPDTKALRDKLFEQYKDRLDDPSVVVEIERQLLELDKEWLKGDISEGFYIKSKSLDIVRKKTFLMLGRSDSGGNATLIKEPLSEGWNMENLPAMVNDLRAGSFDRSANTELGGEAAKFIFRIMQNARISEDDCGSSLGIDVVIDETNKSQYLYNHVFKDGKLIQITDENINSLMGKTLKMRTPLLCKTSRDNFCKICIGGRYAELETALPTAAANIGSIFMGIMMKSFHGKALKSRKWDYKHRLT